MNPPSEKALAALQRLKSVIELDAPKQVQLNEIELVCKHFAEQQAELEKLQYYFDMMDDTKAHEEIARLNAALKKETGDSAMAEHLLCEERDKLAVRLAELHTANDKLTAALAEYKEKHKLKIYAVKELTDRVVATEKEHDCWVYNANELQKAVNAWERERAILKSEVKIFKAAADEAMKRLDAATARLAEMEKAVRVALNNRTMHVNSTVDYIEELEMRFTHLQTVIDSSPPSAVLNRVEEKE